MEQGRRLTCRWFSSEPEPTIVENVLKPEGRDTRLVFRNRGFAEGGAWEDFYERDVTGWLEVHVVLEKIAEKRPARRAWQLLLCVHP